MKNRLKLPLLLIALLITGVGFNFLDRSIRETYYFLVPELSIHLQILMNIVMLVIMLGAAKEVFVPNLKKSFYLLIALAGMIFTFFLATPFGTPLFLPDSAFRIGIPALPVSYIGIAATSWVVIGIFGMVQGGRRGYKEAEGSQPQG